MRKLILMAGAAALTAAAMPAAADAQGRGNGRGNSVRAEQQGRGNMNRGPRIDMRRQAQMEADRRMRRGGDQMMVDRNRDGVDDRMQAGFVDRNRDGIDDRTQDRFVDRNRDGIDDRMQTGFVDRNRDGIDDRSQNRFVDRNRDGVDDRNQTRFGGRACPPGLANRNPACVPPGQARRMFREGQTLPSSYRGFTPYDTLLGRVPEQYRDDIPAGYRYIYNDDSVYVVDPTTRVIRQIINLFN